LRFRVHLAQHVEVDANQVEAQIVGEHGVSAGVPLSSARMPVWPIGRDHQGARRNPRRVREKIESSVRYANITIIEGQ